MGGARSGKSALAEQRAADSGLEVIYIATAQGGDTEMAERIRLHQERRPNHWKTLESPTTLAQTLHDHAATNRCLLVDCLTLWLSNLLEKEKQLQQQQKELLETLPQLPGHIILVSNEVGQGIIPLGEINRRFVDVTGRLHQALAILCDRVTLTVAGLPLNLKG